MTANLTRSQRVVMTIDGSSSSYTFDSPQWVLTELDAPVPPWREDYVTVPGRDGVLDLSRALTGNVVRDARTVRFTVFMEDEDHEQCLGIEHYFRQTFDGKRVRLQTPDSYSLNSAAYYVGNCRLVKSEMPLNYLYLTFEFTCDPWLYLSDGYATLTHSATTSTTGSPLSSVSAAQVNAINERRASIRLTYAASSTAGRETAAMSNVGLWMQRSANCFDASAHTVIDQALPRASASASNAWKVGTAVHRSGQRIYTDELGEDWAQRIILTALNTSDARTQTSGFVPVFPLTGGANSLYIDVFMSGTVTAVGSAAGGKPAGITLTAASASGALNPTSDNWATSASTTSAGSFVPTVGTYNGERIISAQIDSRGAGSTSPLNALVLNVNWLHTGADGLQFAFSISVNASQTTWRAAKNTVALFQLPATLQATGGTGAVTDEATINAVTTEMIKRTQAGWTPYKAEAASEEATLTRATRQWFPTGSGSVTYMQAHPASSDGRACKGLLTWNLTGYNVETASLTIGAMASDLYLENSASPVFLKYAGTSALLPPSATKQLTPFTAAAGTASVSYAILGSSVDGETNRLTWSRGAL